MATSRQVRPAARTRRFRPSLSSAPAHNRSIVSTKRGPDRVDVDRGLVDRLHAQHLQRDGLLAGRAQQERHLAQHPQPQMLGRRQDVGQRHRLARMEQAQVEAVGRQAGRAFEAQAERSAGQDGLQRAEVGDGLVRIETVAIGRGEPVAPPAGGGPSLGLAEARLQGGAQAIAPRGRRLGQPLLQLGEVGRRRVVGLELQGVERLRQRRIAADRGGDRRHLAMPGLLEDRREALAQGRIEALARREHQAGGEAADRVAAAEQRHMAPLLELQDAERMVVERVLLDLEQLVARIGFEDRQQRLAVVAVDVEAGAAQDAVDPPAQQRHVLHHGVVGARGEQAGEAPLAGDPPVGVVGLHDDAVHRADAMDQRRPVGLDDQDVVGPARETGHRLAAAQPRFEQSRPRRGAGCRARSLRSARSAGRRAARDRRHSGSGDGRGR